MNKNAIEIMEYDSIKETLKTYTISDMGKAMIDRLQPYTDINVIQRLMGETTEARNIIERNSSVPLHSLEGIEGIKEKLNMGALLQPEEFEEIEKLLREGERLKRFMKGKEYEAPVISCYALSIYELEEVSEEIDRCILQGRVHDKASSELNRLRKKIAIAEDRIKGKIESILKNPKYKNILQDSIVSIRNGRFVIPVKSQHKNAFEGSFHDSSSSGSTVFIEPEEVRRAQDELNLLRIDEENEVYRILRSLTDMVKACEKELSVNIEIMANYDYIFARAKYSRVIEGRSVSLNRNNIIKINKGRHPLIGKEAIPLDFFIGEDYKILVITGPNTGGKTVALKTVALLTMMVQSGLHVPVGEGSEFAVFADVLADIGDGQSIEQNLSTFSSHIKNIISILKCADRHSLVIIDEVGSGTDPGEGMGIAEAVLEELNKCGAIVVATTHYSEIKDFAANMPGFKNGCMEFDINTLKPTYRLNIGKAGESNAFLIAFRLGMDKSVIERAHEITYKEKIEYGNYIKETMENEEKYNADIIEHKQRVKEVESIDRQIRIKEKSTERKRFCVGDCVFVKTMNRTGIVYEAESSKGEVGVMVMKNKFKINYKRLSLYIDKEELYPEDYDFDIVFETKENRKKDHLMGKRHVEGMEIKKSKE